MTAALSSWRDGPAKQAIVDFVASATQDGPGFIPAADRIAAFDNDGTLWVEQPMPPQFDEEREFAYTKGAEKSLATAEQLGWTLVSIKQDWTTLFNGRSSDPPS